MHLLLGSQEKLLSLEGEFRLEHSFGFCSSLSAPIPRLTGLEWWHTVGGGYTWLFENLLFAWNEACYGNKVWWLESRAPLKNAKPVCALGKKGARKGLCKLRLPQFFSEGGSR